MGCQAEYIIDPLQALAAVERQQPHIAFLDIGMPDIDGYQLAHHIRAKYPREEIALVALTGYASDENRAREPDRRLRCAPGEAGQPGAGRKYPAAV